MVIQYTNEVLFLEMRGYGLPFSARTDSASESFRKWMELYMSDFDSSWRYETNVSLITGHSVMKQLKV